MLNITGLRLLNFLENKVIPTFRENKNIMIKKTFKVFTVSLLMAAPFVVNAQTMPPTQQQQQVKTDFSDKELMQFTKAAEAVNQISQEADAKMVKAIEGAGLELEKFNEIAAAQQNPNAEAPAADEAEMQKFQEVSGQLQEIQTEMQPKMVSAIEDSGMDISKYQEVMLAFQQSPELQAKVKQMMQN